MAVQSGHLSTLSIGGTPTTMTAEPCGGVDADWGIADIQKRQLDPDSPVTVEVYNGSGWRVAAHSEYTLGYTSGSIIFFDALGMEDEVRVSGKFIPLLDCATADNFEFEIGKAELDANVYGTAAAGAIAGQSVLSGSFSVKEDLLTDHDSGGGTLTLQAAILAGEPFFLRFRPGEEGNFLRAWVLLNKGSVKASTGSVVGATVSFKAITRACAGQTEQAYFSFAP